MFNNSQFPNNNDVRLLFREFATALKEAKSRDTESEQFLKRLVCELESANLSPNPSMPETASPTVSWKQIFGQGSEWKSNSLLNTLNKIGPPRTWIRADDFYPEPEHRHFTENVWGSLISGQENAMFSSGECFIALLIVIDSNTTYPLHAHRIEELYYILSGHAEWSHDGKEWETLPPGSIFHNHSNQPHTMRTSDQPLMAMGFYLPPFGWEGGLLDIAES